MRRREEKGGGGREEEEKEAEEEEEGEEEEGQQEGRRKIAALLRLDRAHLVAGGGGSVGCGYYGSAQREGVPRALKLAQCKQRPPVHTSVSISLHFSHSWHLSTLSCQRNSKARARKRKERRGGKDKRC